MVAEAAALELRPDGRPPLVSGHDLMALGLSAGPAIGRLLADIRERQLQDELRNRHEALDYATRRIAERR